MKEGFDGFGVEGALVLLGLVGWVTCLDTDLVVVVLDVAGFDELALTLTEGFDEDAFVGTTFGLRSVFLVG